MASENQFENYKEELKKLLSYATYPYVKQILTSEIEKLEKELKLAQENSSKNSSKTLTNISYSKLTNYGWDQNNDSIEIFLTIDGIQNVPKDNIKCHFSPKSVEVFIHDVIGEKNKIPKNFNFSINNLCFDILPEKSKFKILSGNKMLNLVLAKAKSGQVWPCITQSEKRQKDLAAQKFKNEKPGDMSNSSPEAGLMDLMRKMYEDGDDNMKQVIQKAWHESREKGQNSALPNF